MKPNFEKMSKPELRADVLAHREDLQACYILGSDSAVKAYSSKLFLFSSQNLWAPRNSKRRRTKIL